MENLYTWGQDPEGLGKETLFPKIADLLKKSLTYF